VGGGLGLRREDLDLHPGRGGRAVTLPGVHQFVAAADLDALDAAPGGLRTAGWPAPEHPDSGEDTVPGGRDTIAGRLSDEVSWLRQCAGWLAHLDADSYPPAVSLAEQDRGDVENRLQGGLALGPLKTRLKLAEFAREYPAWRGDHRPGFIDFLGLDRQNRFHVVETKVNPDDVTAVLQALDYVIWVQANAKKIREERRWPESGEEKKSVVCDFVCAPRITPAPDGSLAPSGHAIGRYLAGQLEAISPSVSWTISLVPDPLAEVPEVTVHRSS
jgi:hypothetical protein